MALFIGRHFLISRCQAQGGVEVSEEVHAMLGASPRYHASCCWISSPYNTTTLIHVSSRQQLTSIIDSHPRADRTQPNQLHRIQVYSYRTQPNQLHRIQISHSHRFQPNQLENRKHINITHGDTCPHGWCTTPP